MKRDSSLARCVCDTESASSRIGGDNDAAAMGAAAAADWSASLGVDGGHTPRHSQTAAGSEAWEAFGTRAHKR